MILGMSTSAFTALHVAISLAGIASGLLVLFALMGRTWLPRWNAVFLSTTILTSLTGFAFPFHGMTPGIVVGILSMAVLTFSVLGLYAYHLAGPWRRIYFITAMTALYFNLFVLVVQSFEKVPALQALAPTQTELPFAQAQGTLLLVFVALSVVAWGRLRSLPIGGLQSRGMAASA